MPHGVSGGEGKKGEMDIQSQGTEAIKVCIWIPIGIVERKRENQISGRFFGGKNCLLCVGNIVYGKLAWLVCGLA